MFIYDIKLVIRPLNIDTFKTYLSETMLTNIFVNMKKNSVWLFIFSLLIGLAQIKRNWNCRNIDFGINQSGPSDVLTVSNMFVCMVEKCYILITD